MLLRLVVICGLFWGVMQVAFAQEALSIGKAPEAVLNNPPAAVSVLKDVIEKLDPSYETVWTYSDGTFSQGVSTSLYNFKSNGIHVASVRLGFGTNENLYGGLGLDLPGMAKRWVPEQIKGIATTQPLTILWDVIGKYARVTPIAGYSWGEDKAIYGVAFGAALTF